MKGRVVAAAAVLAGAANAHLHGHHHELFEKRGSDYGVTEICKTYWTTITGPPTIVTPSSTPCPVTTSAYAITSSSSAPATVPTPEAHTCPTPGTYTFPASTITVTDTTTVCGATSTPLPSGTYTIGGVTTIVETSTVVTCPYATVTTSGGVTTSTILTTTYVCPESGTYTIAPITTTVTESTTVTYPTVTTYWPGTYTKPAEVVTVTETDYTTWCPFASVSPSTTAAAAPSPAYSTAPASSPSPNSAPSAPPASVGSDSGNYGVTYTPYTSVGGYCKTSEEVYNDLYGIKAAGFKAVRVYSTDCDTLENVGGAAAKYGLELIIGVFISSGPCDMTNSDIQEQVSAISSWGSFGNVPLFVMGNEAIIDGYCTASELAQLIVEVKAACPGYTGPYTISEPLNIWQNPATPSAMCGVVDLVGANIHAFFNPDTPASAAGDFVAGQLEILDGICEGKKGINLECGWPTKGDCNGVACPGQSEQSTALAAIQPMAGSRTVFFSHENDYWKAPGLFNCEQSWGVKGYFTSLNDMP